MANGFRVFAQNEVLTAANVNDYLAEQAVCVFADASALKLSSTRLGKVLAEVVAVDRGTVGGEFARCAAGDLCTGMCRQQSEP